MIFLPLLIPWFPSLARAKTGTGKTVAFLLPAIERLLKTNPDPRAISVLVLSPTRELAQQIAVEATTLLEGQPHKVQCVVGGTNMNSELSRLNKSRADILVAVRFHAYPSTTVSQPVVLNAYRQICHLCKDARATRRSYTKQQPGDEVE